MAETKINSIWHRLINLTAYGKTTNFFYSQCRQNVIYLMFCPRKESLYKGAII